MFGTHGDIPLTGPDITLATLNNHDTDPNILSSNEILCPKCGRSFTVKNNLRRHMKKFHPDGKLVDQKEQYTQICAICGEKFRYIKDLQVHLEMAEMIQLQYEHKTFYSESDFKDWKQKTEMETRSLYVARSGAKMCSSDEKAITFYVCNRSGLAKFKKIRKSNRQCASIKCGFACPALMKVSVETFHEATEIQVEYQSIHVGHEIADTIIKRKRLRERRKRDQSLSRKRDPRERIIKKKEPKISEAEQQAALMEEIRQNHIAEVNSKQSALLAELQEIQNIIMKTGSLEKLRFIQESFTNVKAYCATVPETFPCPPPIQFPPMNPPELPPPMHDRLTLNNKYIDENQRLYPERPKSFQRIMENTQELSTDNFLYILYQDS